MHRQVAAPIVLNLKFDKLDAMRGVAAWAVLTYHMMQDALPAVVPRAYLAVDFFFTLSGFVLSAAYTRRLASPSDIRSYYLTRLVRLYPLVVLGALLGAAAELHVYAPPALVAILITGALLIPTALAPTSESHVAFAANPPSWSLFFEVLINLAFGAISRFLSVKVLAAIVSISGLALVVTSYAIGSTGGGVYWPTLLTGLPHVCFSFPLGVSLHRLWLKGDLPKLRAPLPVLVLVLITTFSIPRLTGTADIAVDLIAITLIFPTLITAGLTPGQGRIAGLMGDLSYPTYILQAPFAQHVKDLPQHLHLASPALSFLLLLGLQLPYVALAYLAYRGFDQPVRRWLSTRTSTKSSGPAQTAP